MVAYLGCQAMSSDTILGENNLKSITTKFLGKSMQNRQHLSWMSGNVNGQKFGRVQFKMQA